MRNIAIFASGSGSNAENIVTWFKRNNKHEVSLILCNNPDAYVLKRADYLGIKSVVFSKDELTKSDHIIKILEEHRIDIIILAGFLLKIPENIIDLYRGKIINIHPALLPKYGGKGMYGMHVHNAVIENKEIVSGITIHLVDEKYDNGKILFQGECTISEGETPDSLAEKIHDLEQKHFPRVIEQYLNTL